MLELFKELLGIDLIDISKDNILNFYLDKAELAIKSYCNIDAIPEQYNTAICDLAIFFYQNRDSQGVTQKTQGNRSQSLIDGIPKSILVCLPLPKLRVV